MTWLSLDIEFLAVLISTFYLTHRDRVTHLCVRNLIIIGSDNGLLPGRRQAIIWSNAGILLIQTLGTNFSEILSKIHTFSFKKMHFKMSSAKWRQVCLGLNVLIGEYASHGCKRARESFHQIKPNLRPYGDMIIQLVDSCVCHRMKSQQKLYLLTLSQSIHLYINNDEYVICICIRFVWYINSYLCLETPLLWSAFYIYILVEMNGMISTQWQRHSSKCL